MIVIDIERLQLCKIGVPITFQATELERGIPVAIGVIAKRSDDALRARVMLHKVLCIRQILTWINPIATEQMKIGDGLKTVPVINRINGVHRRLLVAAPSENAQVLRKIAAVMLQFHETGRRTV